MILCVDRTHSGRRAQRWAAGGRHLRSQLACARCGAPSACQGWYTVPRRCVACQGDYLTCVLWYDAPGLTAESAGVDCLQCAMQCHTSTTKVISYKLPQFCIVSRPRVGVWSRRIKAWDSCSSTLGRSPRHSPRAYSSRCCRSTNCRC